VAMPNRLRFRALDSTSMVAAPPPRHRSCGHSRSPAKGYTGAFKRQKNFREAMTSFFLVISKPKAAF
jgi:hypothetical protein